MGDEPNLKTRRAGSFGDNANSVGWMDAVRLLLNVSSLEVVTRVHLYLFRSMRVQEAQDILGIGSEN